MNLVERQRTIAEIKDKIDAELGINCRTCHSEKGRNGTLTLASVPKRGMKGVEVMCGADGEVLLSVAIIGKGSDTTAPIIKEILEQEGYVNVKPNQKNPRYEYSLERFKFVYNLLTNHDALEDAIGGRMTPRLFKKAYDPSRILGRYLFAFKNKDQDMLDLARNLLAADTYDKDIAINEPTETRTYREHVVPCIFLHTEIIACLQAGIEEAEKAELPTLVPYSTHRHLEMLIEHNLKIAYIDPKDAEKIDIDLGLRTKMPEGWSFGRIEGKEWVGNDSVTARLDENEIAY